MSAPIVFGLPGYRPLLSREPGKDGGLAWGAYELARFANGELYARIGDRVAGRTCAVLGSLAPPDEQMLSVLLLADTLKREGASRLLAVLPYLGYARQDQADSDQSLGAAWAGTLLGAMGVEQVLTIDVHSPRAAAFFPMPVVSISPAALFAEVLVHSGLTDLSVVAPDEGARERCEAVARAAGIEAPVGCLHKRRDREGVTHTALAGRATRRVAIVDDILDTGGTLLSACVELRRAGAQEITVLVTHGLFTGERWHELGALGVERIYTTDSIPREPKHARDIVEVLPVRELILEALSRIDS